MNKHQMTNEFINKYIINNDDIYIKSSEKNNSIKPTRSDTLFWCIYNIIYPNNIIHNSFIEEKKIKFKWMEMINQNKKLYKKYILIQPFLICHSKINIHTVDAICHLFDISIILTNNNTYIYFNKNETTPVFINYNNGKYTLLKNETYDNVINNYLHIEDYNKLIYAINKYKVNDLKIMALKLCIDVKNKKKNEIYEIIKNKLKLIYLKI
tara:strand:+ start:199 stop:828 length:630 start_codon:yes stop_codon:yes gene_type:complete